MTGGFYLPKFDPERPKTGSGDRNALTGVQEPAKVIVSRTVEAAKLTKRVAEKMEVIG